MSDYPARFDGRGDRFVALFLELAIDAQGRGRADAARAARRIKSFFARPATAEALAADPGAFLAQLTDGARLYFDSCLSDAQYGSTMFGLKRMTAGQVRTKIERDRAAMSALIGSCDAPEESIRLVHEALRGGFDAALA